MSGSRDGTAHTLGGLHGRNSGVNAIGVPVVRRSKKIRSTANLTPKNEVVTGLINSTQRKTSHHERAASIGTEDIDLAPPVLSTSAGNSFSSDTGAQRFCSGCRQPGYTYLVEIENFTIDMVNHSQSYEAQALRLKEKGNAYFQAGDYSAAEELYTQAINHDPNNHLLYTNRAMALLKLSHYRSVISDTKHAISLYPLNMKAYFQLAQAQLALNLYSEALTSVEMAHKLCLEELQSGGKGGNSIGPITELVLKCKKLDWEAREKEREKNSSKVLREIITGFEDKRDAEIKRLNQIDENEKTIKKVTDEYNDMIEETKRVWRLASGEKKRDVPDWCIDDITFSVMLDPVITKTGQSYDRSSIIEHLKRSPTDPLTREPLCPEDLRPNLALRAACQEYLKENGWAVDW
ncbi:hypothetical protein K3495_g10921 [Podosphaera aphanis]|nr:hypothetical protein K3495_g10921 [Podosphaera aphanis]